MNGKAHRVVLTSTVILLFTCLSSGCERAKPPRTLVPPTSSVAAPSVVISSKPSGTAEDVIALRPSETPPPGPLASPTLVPSVVSVPEPTSTPTETVTVPTPTPPPGREITYTVRAGDTLLALAVAHQTTVAAIMDRNDLSDRHTIRVGRVLIIPVGYGATATPPSGAVLTATAGVASPGRTHKVKPGENLSSIAAQYGVSLGSLVQANGLADPSLIRVGQVLVVPEE